MIRPTHSVIFFLLPLLWLQPWVRADLLVGDWYNHQVLRFTDSGTLLGVFGDANDSVGLGIPGGIAVDSQLRLYVKSLTIGSILRFDADGSYLGYYENPASGGHRGLAFDSDGNLWARRTGFDNSEFLGSRLVKFDSNGSIVQEINTRLAGYAQFAFDDQDILYVPRHSHLPFDTDGIYRFTREGVALGPFGQATLAQSGCFEPDGVVFDLAGNLLVDVEGRILKYDPNGIFLGPFAIGNTGGYMMVDPSGYVHAGYGSGNGVVKYDAAGNYLGKIISAGVGGVPANFRNEAIAYLPASIPEPTITALLATSALSICHRRRG